MGDECESENDGDVSAEVADGTRYLCKDGSFEPEGRRQTAEPPVSDGGMIGSGLLHSWKSAGGLPPCGKSRYA